MRIIGIEPQPHCLGHVFDHILPRTLGYEAEPRGEPDGSGIRREDPDLASVLQVVVATRPIRDEAVRHPGQHRDTAQDLVGQ